MSYYSSYPTYWSHHLIIRPDPGIRSNPVHRSYIGHQATCAMMVTCLLWMYSLIVHSPTYSITPATGGTPTLCPLHVKPSYPRSAGTFYDGTPPALSTLLPSPPNSHYHRGAPSAPLIYIISQCPTPFLLYSSTPWISSSSVAEPSAGCDTRTSNRYYYTIWCS